MNSSIPHLKEEKTHTLGSNLDAITCLTRDLKEEICSLREILAPLLAPANPTQTDLNKKVSELKESEIILHCLEIQADMRVLIQDLSEIRGRYQG